MKIKFRPDLEVSSFDEGGDRSSVILKDPVAGKFYRLSEYEFRMLKAFNGHRTLEEAVEHLHERGYYYTIEDAQAIADRAARSGLILGTKYGSAPYQAMLRDNFKKQKRQQYFSSVFFLFVPILNPDRFLERTLGFFKLVYNRWMGILFAVAAVGGVILFVDGWPRLEHQYSYFFNLDNLIYLWVTIAVTKLIHEFAHAYIAKSYGLHVPQMGVAFLIFFPCLYCNTTDAWKLADRKPRIAIAAAGIAAEAVLAVIAIYVWYFTKPGIVNSLAFYLMTVAVVSTVFFNGNPLIRFDGYYVLVDIIRLPNLLTKSKGYLRYLFMNKTLGVDSVASTARDLRERLTFSIYGVGQFTYRMFLYSAIVLGVYYRFDKFIGITLAVAAIVIFILFPLFKGSKTLYSVRGQVHPRFSGMLVFLMILAGIGVLLFVPMSSKSVYDSYVNSADHQKLTVPLRTSVDEVFVKEGSPVRKGSALMVLDTNLLELTLRKRMTERDIVEQQIYMMTVDNELRPKAAEKRAELRKLEREIELLRKDLEKASGGITAPFDGVVTKLDSRVEKGFQPGEGAMVGEIRSTSDVEIYGLIPEEDLHKVQEGQDVLVWFPMGTGLTVKGTIDLVRPYNERDLGGLPFSSRLGGAVATEQKGEQRQDVPVDPLYVCVVRLPGNPDKLPLGITGDFFVPAPPKSLMAKLIDSAARTFNRESLL